MNVQASSKNSSFQIIDQNVVYPHWTGYPLKLNPNQNANMPQTPNGWMVVAYQNLASQNSAGTLSLTSGRQPPLFLSVPALKNQPSILIHNWETNNLSVTNISLPALDIPIRIQAISLGVPGTTPFHLPVSGKAVDLVTYQCAEGQILPGYMQLVMQASSGDLTILAVLGSATESGISQVYLFAINASQDSGPGTPHQPPAGYYATTTSNVATFQFSWDSATILIVNLSPETAQPAQLYLRKL